MDTDLFYLVMWCLGSIVITTVIMGVSHLFKLRAKKITYNILTTVYAHKRYLTLMGGNSEVENAIALVSTNTTISYKSNKDKHLYNCPNCGAVVTGKVCEYCGTHFDL